MAYLWVSGGRPERQVLEASVAAHRLRPLALAAVDTHLQVSPGDLEAKAMTLISCSFQVVPVFLKVTIPTPGTLFHIQPNLVSQQTVRRIEFVVHLQLRFCDLLDDRFWIRVSVAKGAHKNVDISTDIVILGLSSTNLEPVECSPSSDQSFCSRLSKLE